MPMPELTLLNALQKIVYHKANLSREEACAAM